jgi:alpha-glucuronidase
MQSEGYKPIDVVPWETASGGKAVVCPQPTPCTLTATLTRPAGEYTIAVQYFDLRSGVSQYDLLLNGKPIADWAADATLPPAVDDPHLDGHTNNRFTTAPLALKSGDLLTLRGTPHGGEQAPVDYLEITPVGSPKP